MAYDKELADRLREAVQHEEAVSEKPMFGGLAFLVHGNMAVSASSKGGLMVRVNPAESESLCGRPGVRRFEMRGKPMDGWLRVGPEALQSDEDLDAWVRRGVGFARSLPAKG
jgi:TfoX/Sxy family transcriptional regulator of competence genes